MLSVGLLGQVAASSRPLLAYCGTDDKLLNLLCRFVFIATEHGGTVVEIDRLRAQARCHDVFNHLNAARRWRTTSLRNHLLQSLACRVQVEMLLVINASQVAFSCELLLLWQVVLSRIDSR